MKRQDFNYQLPEELIAKFPLSERSSSRLMVLNNQEIFHSKFQDLTNYLNQKDLLIFNNTRVLKARIFGEKFTGGKIEFLLERILNQNTALFQLKSSKPPKVNMEFKIAGFIAKVLDKIDNLYLIQILDPTITIIDLLEKYGEIPLPPYLDRDPESNDLERYQTIFAQNLGAVAAPTCGLHFDDKIFTKLNNFGIQYKFLTLHVGSGTFQPIRVDNIAEHKMHSEIVNIPQELKSAIINTKNNGGKVIAVGTTVVRALESAVNSEGEFQPYHGETNIFIYPGYQFKIIDAMITNFHLPESSLLMLVSAFAGYDQTMHAYQEAIKHKYRFYSYGDAMMILNKNTEQTQRNQ